MNPQLNRTSSTIDNFPVNNRQINLLQSTLIDPSQLLQNLPSQQNNVTTSSDTLKEIDANNSDNSDSQEILTLTNSQNQIDLNLVNTDNTSLVAEGNSSERSLNLSQSQLTTIENQNASNGQPITVKNFQLGDIFERYVYCTRVIS